MKQYASKAEEVLSVFLYSIFWENLTQPETE